jgi:hypothetical protein
MRQRGGADAAEVERLERGARRKEEKEGRRQRGRLCRRSDGRVATYGRLEECCNVGKEGRRASDEAEVEAEARANEEESGISRREAAFLSNPTIIHIARPPPPHECR